MDAHDFVFTRPTQPDMGQLLKDLRALDATAELRRMPGGVTVYKATAWTAGQITAARNAIEAAPEITPQREAQNYIDAMPLAEKAWKLEEMTEFNRLRTALRALGAPGLPDLTIDTVIAAWRARAGTLVAVLLLLLCGARADAQTAVPVTGTVNIGNWPAQGATSSGGLTDAELRAQALAVTVGNWPTTQAVTGTFWPPTQPVSGTVTVSNLPATQPVSGTVAVSNFPATQAVTGPLTDVQLRAAPMAVTGTFWQAIQPVSGAISVSNLPATQATREVTNTGRATVALTYTATAPTTADTVVTTLIKSTAGQAAGGAQSILVAAGKTLRLTAANVQIRTTTAALPWALVTLRLSATTTCAVTSSVLAYLAAGGTAAVIGNVGQFSTQFPDGLDVPVGSSLCISVSGNVATNVITFSAQGFEY